METPMQCKLIKRDEIHYICTSYIHIVIIYRGQPEPACTREGLQDMYDERSFQQQQQQQGGTFHNKRNEWVMLSATYITCMH
jgi:hypothetical protein